MKTLGVIANCSKARAAVVLAEIEKRADAAGIRLVADPETGSLTRSADVVPATEVFDRSDAVMALGGDGTMLKVVRELAERNKPLIGVNIGSLGFMTSVAEDEIAHAVECLAADNYNVAERSMIESTIMRNGAGIGNYCAVNEVLVKATSSRIVTLDLAVDGENVTSYRCDGLMISTPTGSTGHSLSAGGPIIMPGTDVFVISVICPHTLSARPLVVPNRSRMTLETAAEQDPLMISIDGQIGQPLEHGDSVLVKKADRSVRFIHLPDHSYFAVLRQKLNWRGSAV